MGKLYCACDVAGEACEECPNNIMFKPDIRLNCPSWPRTFDTRKLELYKQISTIKKE